MSTCIPPFPPVINPDDFQTLIDHVSHYAKMHEGTAETRREQFMGTGLPMEWLDDNGFVRDEHIEAYTEYARGRLYQTVTRLPR